MNRIKSFFGGRTKAQKRAEAEAQTAQKRMQRDAEMDAQRQRAEANAAGRRLRGAGQRALTWQGQQQSGGLATTLGG